MVNVRPQSHTAGQGRFNVLLTEDREHAIEHWTRQLPRLLKPQGVTAYVARTGREAVEIVETVQMHAALIDLSTPADENEPATIRGLPTPGGLWLLEVLRRLPNHPPVVVVNSHALTPRQIHRFLNEALRKGAFSVVNRPVQLEDLLAVIRRLVDRQYDGAWPKPFDDDTFTDA
jgi:CheY-like chemotaxis protein